MHVRVGVFNCQQISTKISSVIFCAEMLQQFSAAKIDYIQRVLITQPTNSKSLVELIKESFIVTLLIISAVFIRFPLSFQYVLKRLSKNIFKT